MDLQVKNKCVLVQGSSAGLGYAIAKAYVQEGAKVAICSRDHQRIAKAAQDIGAEGFACDLSKRGEGQKLIEHVVQKLGGIDIVITNTGGPPKGLFSELSTEAWQKGFEQLWLSATETLLHAQEHMKKKKWGRIILSTSTAAKEPIPQLTISNGLRAGLLGLMKSLSLELAPYGITVNSILPGYTRTERLQELGVSEDQLVRDIPAKRLAEPEEFAALALFLGSAQAGYITGQAIACDGGLIRGL